MAKGALGPRRSVAWAIRLVTCEIFLDMAGMSALALLNFVMELGLSTFWGCYLIGTRCDVKREREHLRPVASWNAGLGVAMAEGLGVVGR